MLNRKGHIPTFLLLIGAIVLIASTWFSFLTYSKISVSESSKFDFISTNIAFRDEYVQSIFAHLVDESAKNADKNNFADSFYNNFVERAAKIEEIHGLEGNFFGLIRNLDRNAIRQEGQNYYIQIDRVRLDAESGTMRFTRSFDLGADFNTEGLGKIYKQKAAISDNDDSK